LLPVEDRHLDSVSRGFPLPIGLPFPVCGDVHLQHIFELYDVADVAKQGMPVDATHGFKPSLTEENGLSIELEPMPLGLP
jgi:hypothetical protein